jgi:hypothetical protein
MFKVRLAMEPEVRCRAKMAATTIKDDKGYG